MQNINSDKMRGQQKQQKAYNLLLPPIRLYERSRTTNQLINQYMNLLQIKKNELHKHLNEKESYNDNHQLEYIKNSFQQPNYRTLEDDNEAYQQQLMARGALNEEKVYTQVPNKVGLLKKQLNYSKIQPKIHKTYKYRMASKMDSIKQKQDVGQPQSCRFQRRYDTEPHRKQQPSPVDKYRLFSLKPQQYTRQRREKSQSDRSDLQPRQSILYLEADQCRNKQQEQTQARGQVQIQNFSPIRIFQNQKEENVEKRIQESEIKQFISLQKKSQLMNPQNSFKLMQFYEAINALKKSTKTNQRLEKAVIALQGFNPFFKKLQKVVGVCLLRIGKVLKKDTQFPLYQIKVPYQNFFIILAGKVELKGKQRMRKICQTGETLLQQILFEQTKNAQASVSLQKAKLVEESWLLQVDLNELMKLQKQLIRFGFRRGLNEFKNILKRNYIVKNWLRNKFKHLNNH